jgi:glycosyltransferase involved in cell wall biosynthesis
MYSIGIFIPAYNVERFIKEVVGRIPDALDDIISTIWIINDGSSDNTGNIAKVLAEKDSRIKIIDFKNNLGYGAVVKAGISAAKKSAVDYAICLHGDAQYPPESIPEMVKKAVEGGFDIVQGSRHLAKGAAEGGMPFYKIFSGKVLVWLENRIFSLNQTDYHSGFLCYSRSVLEKVNFDNLSPSFDIDLEIIASARTLDLKISEIAIPTRYGDEISYLNPFFYGLRVLKVLVKYVRHN